MPEVATTTGFVSLLIPTLPVMLVKIGVEVASMETPPLQLAAVSTASQTTHFSPLLQVVSVEVAAVAS